ncbi:MAG: ribosome maturation factor RimM [Terriglobia bacterium]
MPPRKPADSLTTVAAPRRTVARLTKSQGRRGEVAAQILTDFPDRLRELRSAWLWDGTSAPELIEIEKAWFHKNVVVFKFAGVNSIAAARALVGREVQVSDSPTLPAHTYFVSDLVGCRVVDLASGAELGTVCELVATRGTDVLALRDAAGRELLIPFAQEFCRRIAPQEKLIEVALPAGLADLNP